MKMLKERIGKMLEYLKQQIYPVSIEIQQYKMIQTEERFQDIENLHTSNWKSFNREQFWGGHREYYWFETFVTVPEEFDGKCLAFEVRTGCEGQWDATNPQFSIYVDGVMIQGLDVNHREIILAECAEAGRSYRIILSAFTGDQNFRLKLESSLKILDREVEHYYYDLAVLYQTALLLQEEDQDYIRIIHAVNESLNLLDFRKEGSREFKESLRKAQEYITKEFYEKYSQEDKTPVVYSVGHTHIDCAWLWTLRVTQDKAVRSFSTVLELMRQYPEYVFMSSQPQLYQYVKKNAPQIYEQIKERVREGRWEAEGGMFVEADCNLASGEALVRQFLYGKRFFKEEFGVDNQILWLPDVFGYSAALPQIMKKCGLSYFMTTKISWNEKNKMPYDTFLWEGIDGTKVLTHFIPTRDFDGEIVEGSERTTHFTTYNGEMTPSQTKGAWKRYSQKYLNEEVLCSFGYGDGGGGPTREMLENQRRMSRGIPGLPRTKPSTALEFFKKLEEKVMGKKYLPSWVGELYLEYHRGTYTTMARNKRYNRKSEFAYENEEFYASLDHYLCDGDYPKKELAEGWVVILRNQFHDILPGSSIKEVYEDSKEEYEKILTTGKQLTDQTLRHLTENICAKQGSLVVFNPNGMEMSDVVTFDWPVACDNAIVLDGEKELLVQKISSGKGAFLAQKVPAKGYKTFYAEFVSGKDNKPLNAGMENGQMSLKSDGENLCDSKVDVKPIGLPCDYENAFFRLQFNEKGQFSSIYDKRANREILKTGTCGNVIMSYEDRPHNWEAWDINDYYQEKYWEVDDVSSFELVEDGPVCTTWRVSRKYLDSVIEQYITVYAEKPEITIRNVIDWKEHQILLKDYFPLDVHTSEATFDIQYGNVKRNTHDNTSWDEAKFEVCHHKWLDVSEDGYGVSILNDCKYGVSVRDSVVGLSMLKSSIYPNPEADKERHEFTYTILPHLEGWRDADTVARAYALNNPLHAVQKKNEAGTLPECFSLVQSDQKNVVIEVVKRAEDLMSGMNSEQNSDNDSDQKELVLRLYECYNRRTEVALSFCEGLEPCMKVEKNLEESMYKGNTISAVECNMLEEEEQELEVKENQISFIMKPYEIKTIKVKMRK